MVRSIALAFLAGAVFLAGAAHLSAQVVAAGGCPPQGDATKAKIRKLNEVRARLDDVTDDDVDDAVTAEALFEPGDDRLRWQDGQGVEITAYVVEVRDGGPSSSNCHSPRSGDHDTILELAPSASGIDPAHRFYAVVTPQWRQAVAADRVDWSTDGLRAHYVQRWVIVRGWLLFDPEAAASALHTTALMGPGVPRMSAWEIHPVTALDLQDDVLDQEALLPLPAGLDHQRETPSSRERWPQASDKGGGEGSPYTKSNASSSAP